MSKFDGAFGVFLVFMSIALVVIAQEMPQAFVYKQIGPGLWPTCLATVLGLCGAALFFDSVIRKIKAKGMSVALDRGTETTGKNENAKEKAQASANLSGPKRNTIKFIVVLVLSCVLIYLAKRIGFLPSAFAFLFAAVTILGYRPYAKAALTSALLTLGIAFLFGALMGVSLPEGTGIFKTINNAFLSFSL